MTPDTALKLGDFTFARFEIPEQIPFGGEQRLTVHELVGGVRVLDAMGATPMPIEWSGFFVGEAAVERARYVDGLRKAGKPLDLAWHAFAFKVVVKSFHCEFKRFSRVPYRIVCEVVEDRTAPVDRLSTPGVDQLIAGDMSTANALASSIGDGALSSLMGSLNGAIATVGSFAKAAQSTLGSVLGPLADVRAQVGVLTQAASNTIQNVTTLGGILPGNPIAQQANKLLGQIRAVTQSPALINLDRVLGRVQANIGTINSGTQKVAVAGGNLYALAVQHYGDAMAWTAIAQANGRQDPQVTGVTQLTIPPNNNPSNGVLHA